MCNVKTGIDVKHKGDLQNLITSVILRQTDKFTVEDICDGVNDKLVGSKYHNNGLIRQYCQDTINILFNINSVRILDDEKYQLAMSWPSINKR